MGVAKHPAAFKIPVSGPITRSAHFVITSDVRSSQVVHRLVDLGVALGGSKANAAVISGLGRIVWRAPLALAMIEVIRRRGRSATGSDRSDSMPISLRAALEAK